MTTSSEVPVVYRLFSSTQLLYVGLSENYWKRLVVHRAVKPWWPEVTHITVQPYAHRSDASWAEYVAIRDERPVHNRLPRGAPWRSSSAPLVAVPLGPPEDCQFSLNLPDQEKRDPDDSQ